MKFTIASQYTLETYYYENTTKMGVFQPDSINNNSIKKIVGVWGLSFIAPEILKENKYFAKSESVMAGDQYSTLRRIQSKKNISKTARETNDYGGNELMIFVAI
ncbi:14395_t:CDS:2 [Ambispora leptoticha]|uniref:14395_t:CDS:1 n=1 Tax=Ambispora leptoticha TaxID=144679 RepID=A0A9N9F098_9GLOM|nr:14395_t:CDS:2 [Ambispora leptoticha]